MSCRSYLFIWRRGAYSLFLIFLIWAVAHRLSQPLWDEPEIVVEMGKTYEDLRRSSSAPFSPQIPRQIWFGIPMTDARLRFIDPQFGFTTPAARFFTVDFDDDVIWGIRMSPQVEPLLIDDAMRVALDLQSQWQQGGWRVAGRQSFPPLADTPEWRAQLRDENRGAKVYWKAGKKYQVLMVMHRFQYDKRPTEERYLITLSIGAPWTPFEEDGDDTVEVDQSNPITAIFPARQQGAQSCQLPSS